MKKNLAVVLFLVMCLLLTACGGGEVAQNQEVAQPENELSLGRIEGGIYTNTYAGFSCELDSNWTFLSAKELDQIPSAVSDVLSGSELGDALADVQQFTDMMAENINALTSINVLYQKLGLQERLAYAMLPETQVVDSVLEQSNMMIESYALAGISVISMEKVSVNFAGRERFALHTTATIQNTPYYILQFFDFNLGEYGITTTLASYVEDNTENLLALFNSVE